jgi:biofilm PGA synthesis N-glycosyltransferase PgaC
MTAASKDLSYILITPARNEEKLIGMTVESIVAQTVRPKLWIIVSDGSTDRTDEIVKYYESKYSWIDLIRMPEHRDRNFAAKVHCFNAAYQKVRTLDYQIIGNLDADISLEADYFEFLLEKFATFPDLGVAGTAFVEDGRSYDYRFTNIEHVSGGCQLFRRKCFEDIDGYVPIKGGGIDWVAVTTARMHGWSTRTFLEKRYMHHRKMGTASNNAFMACFRRGRQDYFFGGHPLWQLFRSCYQMRYRPYIIGGLLLGIGYAWSLLNRVETAASSELIQFHRSEQLRRLKGFFTSSLRKIARAWSIRSDSVGGCQNSELIMVLTSLIGKAFLDNNEILQDEQHFIVLQSVYKWIISFSRSQVDFECS